MKTLFDPKLTFEEAEELIRNGADVNEQNGIGETPLFKVMNSKIARLLINHGADVNHERTLSFTPLMVASNIQIIKVLVQNGADIHKRSSYGHSCLHMTNNPKIINYFLDLGVDINIRMYIGTNMLYNASKKFAIYLIEKGILPSTVDDYLKYRDLFTKEQQMAFDTFMNLTNNNDDFFQMCLSYKESIKNDVKIDIKDMDIL